MDNTQLDRLAGILEEKRLEGERLIKLADVCAAQLIKSPQYPLWPPWKFFGPSLCPDCCSKLTSHMLLIYHRSLYITHYKCTRCPYEWAEKSSG